MMSRLLWNAFVAASGPRSGAFLQSWEWGEFQQALGRDVYRLGDLRDFAIGVVRLPLTFGKSYLYAPRGPIVSSSEKFDDASLALRELGEKHQALFVRFEPPIEHTKQKNFGRKSISVQPEETLLLNLDKSEEALLAAMHSKTRYNIRVAERHGITIRVEKNFNDAWSLFQATGKRGAFHIHPRSYYERLLRTLTSESCKAFLVVPRYQHTVVAANIMIDFGGTRTYLHGASRDQHRNVMAPYLLHWHLIQDAKKHGLHRYDWWGVAPEGAHERHAWTGITRFKLGFGGERVTYPGTFDLVLQPGSYALYQFARKMVRVMR